MVHRIGRGEGKPLARGTLRVEPDQLLGDIGKRGLDAALCLLPRRAGEAVESGEGGRARVALYLREAIDGDVNPIALRELECQEVVFDVADREPR